MENRNGKRGKAEKKVVYIDIEPNTMYVVRVPPEVCDKAEIQTKEQLIELLLKHSGGDIFLMAEQLTRPFIPLHSAGILDGELLLYPAFAEPIELPWEGISVAGEIMNFYSHVSWNAIQDTIAAWEKRNFLDTTRRSNNGPLGWVYLVKSGDVYKIGMSNGDVKKRIETLQTGSPTPIETVCLLQTNDASGLEAELHEKFKDKRTRGEWFSLTSDDIDYILSLADDD